MYLRKQLEFELEMKFYKYQGAGNDFIMVDDRNKEFSVSQPLIASLCDRKFGIGADGLILLQNHADVDFEMVYFNADGNESTMCGNGGRCIVAFAKDLQVLTGDLAQFQAIDGLHKAKIQGDKIFLQMIDVAHVHYSNDNIVLNTGSPHYIKFISEGIHTYDVYNEGKAIRDAQPFTQEGINVNFVQLEGQNIIVRTYERGVENETLSCGTGVTAAAIATYIQHGFIPEQIKTLGGNLQVHFDVQAENRFENIWLIGPAKKVFEGTINIPV